MEEKVTLALLGGLIGVTSSVITAVVTSVLNKRAFREELAESEVLKKQLEDYRTIWEVVAEANFNTIQLVHGIVNLKTQLAKQGLAEEQILLEANKRFTPELREILKTVMKLNKYYVNIPVLLIETLKRYEDSIFKVLMQNKWDKAKDILPFSEDVFKTIREVSAELIRRKRKVSNAVGGMPSGGFLAEYVKGALG